MCWTSMSCTSGSAFWPFWTSPRSPGCNAHPDQPFGLFGCPRGLPGVLDIDVQHIRISLVAFLDVPEVTWMQWTSMSCTSGSAFWPFWTSPGTPGCNGHRCPAHPDQPFHLFGCPRGHRDVTDISVLHIRNSLWTIFDVPEITRMCWTSMSSRSGSAFWPLLCCSGCLNLRCAQYSSHSVGIMLSQGGVAVGTSKLK